MVTKGVLVYGMDDIGSNARRRDGEETRRYESKQREIANPKYIQSHCNWMITRRARKQEDMIAMMHRVGLPDS